MIEEKDLPTKLQLDLNMKDIPGEVTWVVQGRTIQIKIVHPEAEVNLDIGPDGIRQLKQALSWT